MEGVKATPKAINDLLIPAQVGGGRGARGPIPPPLAPAGSGVKKPGERIKLRISRDGVAQEVNVELGRNVTRTYSLQSADGTTALQAAILKDWLRSVQ